MMRVLICCEFSGIVRDAFIARGFDAMSCDLLPTERPGPHYQGDVRDILNDGWDLMIAHPPCTYLSWAGQRWFDIEKYGDKARGRWELRQQAVEFIKVLWDAPIQHIAIENPRGYAHKVWRPADQIIQPYQFGDPEQKTTCLWLKNLPKLQPTKIVEPEAHGIMKTGRRAGQKIYFAHAISPSADRWKRRSITFPGIANAMAEQWGRYLLKEKE